MEDLLIIADIAGQFDALMRLIARVPETTKILAVGDLVDRGPNSKEVIEWFMANSHRADSLQGNHEHLMIDFTDDLGIYGMGVWQDNGGNYTLQSYGSKRVFVPTEHIAWLATRKRYKMIPGEGDIPDLFVSHAALSPHFSIEEAASANSFEDHVFRHGLLWNRNEPTKKDFFQVFGHNSHWGLKKFEDWAICIDGSASAVLTGFLWPSREIIQEPYSK